MTRQQPTVHQACIEFSRVRPGFDQCDQLSRDGESGRLPRNLPLNVLAGVKGQTGVDFSPDELLAPFHAKGSQGRLMPFQEEGAAWLCQTQRAVLADEMGLGKTAQAISALHGLIQRGDAYLPFLVICPKSLLLTWMKEFRIWAPDLAISLLLPSQSASEFVWRERPMRAHGVVTSYEQLRQHGKRMATTNYSVVVCDEAHRLRNHTSALHKSLRKLDSRKLWLLTGTPIERDAGDFLNLLSLLEPTRFSRRLVDIPDVSIRSMASPYILRRERDTVLDQLPEHSTTEELLSLTDAQSARYKELLREPDPNALSKLQRLLALCDLDPVSGASSKIDRLLEILSEVRARGQKAIVFSHKLAPLHVLEDRIAESSDEQRSYFLSGKISLGARESIIGQWRSDPRGVLLASLQVAGEGLTLTEANWVIFLNQWWNPSSNAQARDRVRRIGQSQSTFEIVLRTVGTVEERVHELIQTKELTAERVVGLLREESEQQGATA